MFVHSSYGNTTPFPWDIDGDGHIGIDDMYTVASHVGWDANQPKYDLLCDINKDNYVGIDDLFSVVLHFGEDDPNLNLDVPLCVKGINTWCSHFQTREQATAFVTACKNAGYNVIFAATSGLYNRVEYVDLPMNGGIFLQTSDPFLQPLVNGSGADYILEEGHKIGLKIVAFESCFDTYGLRGKKGFNIALPGQFDYWKVAQWHPQWQQFWRHYMQVLKQKGFDGIFWDEYGSEGKAIWNANYAALQGNGYRMLFSNSSEIFGAKNVFVTVQPNTFGIHVGYINYSMCQELGVRLSPWTNIYKEHATEYRLLPDIPYGNDFVVWLYPRWLLNQTICSVNTASELRLQCINAVNKGASGAIYWVAWNGDENTAYFDELSAILNEVIE
jgi:hypothetical protein